MDIRDRRLKARLSKWSTCSVETKRGLVKPRKVTMFKRFLSYYEPQMGLFVADTVCALVLAAIDLAFPIILRNLTGGLFTHEEILVEVGAACEVLLILFLAHETSHVGCGIVVVHALFRWCLGTVVYEKNE